MERNNVMMMMGEVTDADAQGLTIIEDQTGQTFSENRGGSLRILLAGPMGLRAFRQQSG